MYWKICSGYINWLYANNQLIWYSCTKYLQPRAYQPINHTCNHTNTCEQSTMTAREASYEWQYLFCAMHSWCRMFRHAQDVIIIRPTYGVEVNDPTLLSCWVWWTGKWSCPGHKASQPVLRTSIKKSIYNKWQCSRHFCSILLAYEVKLHPFGKTGIGMYKQMKHLIIWPTKPECHVTSQVPKPSYSTHWMGGAQW